MGSEESRAKFLLVTLPERRASFNVEGLFEHVLPKCHSGLNETCTNMKVTSHSLMGTISSAVLGIESCFLRLSDRVVDPGIITVDVAGCILLIL
jgi:hypothetical protein